MQSHECSTKRAFAHAGGRGVRACQVCVAPPLAAEEHVVQLGERANRDAGFAWPDVNSTAITRINAVLGPLFAPARDSGRMADMLV